MSALVKLLESGHIIRSPAPRPNPLRCVSKSLMVNSSVTQGLYILNSGIYCVTLSSHLIFCSSTNMPSAAAVYALLLDAIPKSVFSSTFWRVFNIVDAPFYSTKITTSIVYLVFWVELTYLDLLKFSYIERWLS